MAAARTQAKRVQITPLTHTIESYRNARMTWAGCLAELVDNALSPEKGAATFVNIAISATEVRVVDDGEGIDDVSRVIRPGDSGSWSNSSDIGLYGIGATQALLWMGRRSEVHTIRGQLYTRAFVDWDELLRRRRSDRWEARVEELGHVELVDPGTIPEELRGRRQGTLLVAAKRVRGRRSPHAREIRQSLAKLFTPALRQSRRILVSSASSPEPVALAPLSPPTLADPITFRGEINEKPFSGEAGVLERTDARIAGIWFGYQHRMIVRKTAADLPGLPSNVYGYVELAPAWRRSLSTFKDDIVRDLDPLLESVREQIAEVIQQGLRWNKDLKVDWLRSQLATALFRAAGGQEGRRRVRVEAAERASSTVEGEQREGGSKKQKPPDSIDDGGEGHPEDSDADTGLRIESDPNRDPFVWTDIGDGRIVVSFDPNHPHFEKSLAEPVDCPAFYGAIGASFASALSKRTPEEIHRVFPSLRGRLSESDVQRFAAILDEFTRRTAAVKDRPTMAQIERDVGEVVE